MSESRTKRPKLLIVEDEPELAELLSGFFRRHGFATRIAGDGLTACRLTEQFRPHLILLDILLPGMDGWEVCRMIRRVPDRSLAGIPIIMVSALNSPEDRDKGIALGAEEYIAKPYRLRELMSRVNRVLAETEGSANGSI
jgi:DNA-binding response OmpR family regulator